ncbi:MAG: hypothetical protein OJF48_002194 [Afipia sp.]|nr:MAG: hypothetical protein OJF48_002194 [Afipia sp.]
MRKFHHKKQPKAVTRKSRSASNLKRLGQRYWRILKCVFAQFARLDSGRARDSAASRTK